MIPTSWHCDHGDHVDCAADGSIAVYIKQDGPQRYTCQCYCHRIKAAVAGSATPTGDDDEN